MKTKVFFFVIALISIFFLTSCGPSKEEKVEAIKKINSTLLTEIFTITDPEVALRIYCKDDIDSKVRKAAYAKWEQLMLKKISVINEEEQSLLTEILTITNPEIAFRIYCNNEVGSRVGKAAYAKWEQLMMVKISSITDIKVARQTFYNETSAWDDSSKVRKSAYAKWEQLMLKKISTITDPDVVYPIYYNSELGLKVAEAAYSKWNQLMFIKISTMTDPEWIYQIYCCQDIDSNVKNAAYKKYKALGGKK